VKAPSNVPQLKSGFAIAHVPIRVKKEAFGQDTKFLDVPNENFNEDTTSVVASQASTIELTANDIV